MKIARVMYSVREAAEVLNIAPESLLELVLRDKAKVFTRIPDHLALFNVEWFDLHPPEDEGAKLAAMMGQTFVSPVFRRPLPPPPIRVHDLKFLAVGTRDCIELLKTGSAGRRGFMQALELGPDDQFVAVEPKTPPKCSRDEEGSLLRIFALYPRASIPSLSDRASWQSSHRMEFTFETIYLSSFDLDRLREDKEDSAIFDPRRDVPLPEGDHISAHLNRLWHLLMDQSDIVFRAAQGNATELRLPSRDELARTLLNDYEFDSKKKAKGGAAALAMSSIKRSKAGQWELHAPGFLALHSCAVEHWRPCVQSGKSSPTPEKLFEHIKEKTKLADSKAGLANDRIEGCIALIRPEGAPKGRPSDDSKG